MEVTSDQIKEAMNRFLEQGGSVNRYDKIVGEPLLSGDMWITEETLELVEIQEPDLIS